MQMGHENAGQFIGLDSNAIVPIGFNNDIAMGDMIM